MKRVVVGGAVFAVLAALLTGCSTNHPDTANPPQGTSISAVQLIGKWVPVNATATKDGSFAKFTSDGRWTGKDACGSATQGNWSLASGTFHESAGRTAFVSCVRKPQQDLIRELGHATRISLVGDDRIVIFGAQNMVLGQASRSLTPLG